MTRLLLILENLFLLYRTTKLISRSDPTISFFFGGVACYSYLKYNFIIRHIVFLCIFATLFQNGLIMKKTLLFLAVLISASVQAQTHYRIYDNIDESDCSCLSKESFDAKEGVISREYIHLYGPVKKVTNPKEKADFKVRVAKKGEDYNLLVSIVGKNRKAVQCGHWHWVDGVTEKAKFSVQFVEKGEDFVIKFGEALPDDITWDRHATATIRIDD